MKAAKDKSKAAVMLLGLCSFISYAVFHGLVGCYIFTINSLILDPRHLFALPNPQADARLFAAALIGIVIGIYAGILAWLPHHVFKQTLGFARRCITIVSPALMGAGLQTMLTHPDDWGTLVIYFIPGAVLGLTTGLITEARRNPWVLLFLGVSRRDNNPFAIVSGLALRLAGLFGLLAFVLVIAAYSGWTIEPTREEVVFLFSFLTYFGLTILIASISLPRWIVVVSGVLINVPTVILAVKWWDTPSGRGFFLMYLLVWFLFIVGRLVSARYQSVKVGPRQKTEPALVKGR